MSHSITKIGDSIHGKDLVHEDIDDDGIVDKGELKFQDSETQALEVDEQALGKVLRERGIVRIPQQVQAKTLAAYVENFQSGSFGVSDNNMAEPFESLEKAKALAKENPDIKINQPLLDNAYERLRLHAQELLLSLKGFVAGDSNIDFDPAAYAHLEKYAKLADPKMLAEVQGLYTKAYEVVFTYLKESNSVFSFQYQEETALWLGEKTGVTSKDVKARIEREMRELLPVLVRDHFEYLKEEAEKGHSLQAVKEFDEFKAVYGSHLSAEELKGYEAAILRGCYEKIVGALDRTPEKNLEYFLLNPAAPLSRYVIVSDEYSRRLQGLGVGNAASIRHKAYLAKGASFALDNAKVSSWSPLSMPEQSKKSIAMLTKAKELAVFAEDQVVISQIELYAKEEGQRYLDQAKKYVIAGKPKDSPEFLELLARLEAYGKLANVPGLDKELEFLKSYDPKKST